MCIMIRKVSDIADVMVGLVLSRKEAENVYSTKQVYKALTLRSMDSDGWIDKDMLDVYHSVEVLDDRYLSLEGDILIKVTPPYTAVAINADTCGFVIPAQFIIIRIFEKDVIPEYLSLFLNSAEVKRHIIVSATGMTVPMIKTMTIRDLKIPIRSTKVQKKISEISTLIVRERQLLTKLTKLKEDYYQTLTSVLIKEEK